MEALFIKGTDDTPEVNFDKDKGVFLISGNSFSDDPVATFDPIFNWVKDYITQPNNQTVIEVKLNYINTSSSKQISDLLRTFEKIPAGCNVKLKWYYDKMDEDMLFEGDTLKSIISYEVELVDY